MDGCVETPPRIGSTRAALTRRFGLLLAILTLTAVGPLAADASASHFRHGNLNWTKTAGAPAGSQRITVQYEQSWRWDSFNSPTQGSVIENSEGCIDWGDATQQTCPQYLVEFVNAAENYMRIQALAPGSQTDINVPHDYANPSGVFTISTSSCCTIGTLQNASGSSWNILSTVNLAGDDESALSTIPAIVTLAPGGVRQFTVPANDVGGESLFFRLSTAAESCVGCLDPHPPDLSINSSTGQVTFDTTNKSGLYWTGVVIESRNAFGAVVATSHIQYIINVGAGGVLNQPPVWDSPTPADETVFDVDPGGTVSFSLQASDPDAGNTVSILKNSGPGTFTPTNGNPATGTYSFTATAQDAGQEHIVQFIAQDQDGAGPPFRSYTIRVGGDRTPPDTTIDSGPTGTISTRNPSFTFSSTEPTGATFQCKLDGPGATTGSYAACTSPKAFESLADGTYTFSVKAKDAAGNEDATPAERSFTVDTTGPDTTITAGPSGTTNDATPTFEFISPEPGATFQCRVGSDSDFAPCTSPHTTAVLADGEHTFEVRALDALGNFDPSPASRTITVASPSQEDTTPPDTRLVLASPAVTQDTTPTFEFTSTEAGSTFECSLDGGPFLPCTSPYTTPPLPLGSHSFQVRAIDPAGNVDPSPASSFEITGGRPFVVVAVVEPPKLGKVVNAVPVSGQVFVSVPSKKASASASVPGLKGRKFVPLRDATALPVRTIFDTRKGKVQLTTARNSKGATQAGDFSQGVFQVLQSGKSRAQGLTELRLKGASFRACSSRRAGKRSSALAQASRPRTIRRLSGKGKGRFSTRGRYSSATVRGTVWSVFDRCDGTLTKVGSGRVAVRDFRRRKTVVVRAGKSYLARPRR